MKSIKNTNRIKRAICPRIELHKLHAYAFGLGKTAQLMHFLL